jgi:hypothetical protein
MNLLIKILDIVKKIKSIKINIFMKREKGKLKLEKHFFFIFVTFLQ